MLDQFVRNFGASSIELDGLGRIKSEDLPGRTYHDRVFGDFTCVGCLDGVPGSRDPGEERCVLLKHAVRFVAMCITRA